TWSMVLGKFNFVRDLHGKHLLVRGADDGEIFGWDSVGNHHVEPLRLEEPFLQYVRDIVAGHILDAQYVIPRDEVAFTSRIHSDANSLNFHACDYVSFAVIPGTCGSRWRDIFDQPPPVTGNQSK